MKRRSALVSVTLFGIAAVLAACGGGEATPAPPPVTPTPPVLTAPPPEAPRVTPDAPFREKAPAATGAVTFTPPKVVEAKLKNGLRVLVVERHDLPVVSARLVLGVGAGDVPDAKPGSMSFLGAMIEQGTKKRTALQISDDYEAVGAAHGASVEWDSANVSIRALTDKFDAALAIMADVALDPTFPDAEIERFRARRIASIQSEKSSPAAIAQNNVAAALFGRAHPYGHSISGEEADAKALTRADLVKAYEKVFAPQNGAIVVAGDVTLATLLPKLEATFGAWRAKPGASAKKPPKTPAKAATDKRLVFVDRPGAQSQIQLVRPGVPYARKDRDAILVTNAIFGGMFSSRVNLNLREKNSYTYGARSYFVMRHGAGPFFVGAPVFVDKTGPAIKEVLNELDAIRKGPTEDELALAKENIRLAMPGRFESTSDVTSAVADLVVYDLPLDEYEKRPARIDAVTADDVKRVANEFLLAEAMTFVVVGEKAKVAPQLEELKLGPADERDPFGNALGAGTAKKDAPKDTPPKDAPTKAPTPGAPGTLVPATNAPKK